ncbi:Os11g0228201 [Oryza sativa Japonica Group]|uniref:Os11g0228201 protein n=1 Tax=Oryza sativa subsp. japonica TaxID=39947 RepID=A0A0P0Y0X3_ORYSJ|nr:Os11g0228201 [Oryza sativa Japonica Group]
MTSSTRYATFLTSPIQPLTTSSVRYIMPICNITLFMVVNCFLICSIFSSRSFRLLTFSDSFTINSLVISSAKASLIFVRARRTASAICAAENL